MHNKDIMHCDIKPENMFLHRHGVKLIGKLGDLGLARELVPTRGVPIRRGMPTRGVPTGGYQGVLQTTESWGTLAYMAPECRKSQVNCITMLLHACLACHTCLYVPLLGLLLCRWSVCMSVHILCS